MLKHESRQLPSWLIFDVRQKMRHLLLVFLPVFAGCAGVSSRPAERKMTPEEAIGTFYLMSAFSGRDAAPEFLSIIYPLRSQIVTFAVIGYHRDRGAWPATAEEIAAYAASSPANPDLPEGALAGFAAERLADGGLRYSTLEDRQPGRELTLSSSYKLTFPVPSFPFATPTSHEAPTAQGSTMTFNWGEFIARAMIELASKKR